MLALVILLFSVLALGFGSTKRQCTSRDRRIWEREGHRWPHQFRAYGGLWTGRDSYEEQVRHATGLSAPCARCYGVAYECGKDNCKWSCMTEGVACDACLEEAGCLGTCKVCTGF